jgi:hypothetical protein
MNIHHHNGDYAASTISPGTAFMFTRLRIGVLAALCAWNRSVLQMTGTGPSASATDPTPTPQPTAAHAIPANNRHDHAVPIAPIQPTTPSPDKPFARLPPQCQDCRKGNPVAARNLLALPELQSHPPACCLAWIPGTPTVGGRWDDGVSPVLLPCGSCNILMLQHLRS